MLLFFIFTMLVGTKPPLVSGRNVLCRCKCSLCLFFHFVFVLSLFKCCFTINICSYKFTIYKNRDSLISSNKCDLHLDIYFVSMINLFRFCLEARDNYVNVIKRISFNSVLLSILNLVNGAQ